MQGLKIHCDTIKCETGLECESCLDTEISVVPKLDSSFFLLDSDLCAGLWYNFCEHLMPGQRNLIYLLLGLASFFMWAHPEIDYVHIGQ